MLIFIFLLLLNLLLNRLKALGYLVYYLKVGQLLCRIYAQVLHVEDSYQVKFLRVAEYQLRLIEQLVAQVAARAAALSLGYLSGAQFDNWVRAEQMLGTRKNTGA